MDSNTTTIVYQGDGMIDVKNLKFSYHHDGTYQVDDISFTIQAGETFGLWYKKS
jgi:ABC-type bacteriocin/lantibiotic exporter with double-glycine peptidase domain